MVLFLDGELAVCLLDPLLWCVVIIQQRRIEGLVIYQQELQDLWSSYTFPLVHLLLVYQSILKSATAKGNSSVCHATRSLLYNETVISTQHGFRDRNHTPF